MANDFASGLASGFNAVSRSYNDSIRDYLSSERNKISQQRANAYAQGLAARLPLMQAQTAIAQETLKEMPEKLQSIINAQNLQSEGQQIQLANLQLQQAKLAQLTSNQAKNQRNAGENYKVKLPTGHVATFQKPYKADIANNQKVIEAYPQFIDSMKAIQKGAARYENAGGKAKNYIAAMYSYMTGVPTEAQQKIISQSNIAQGELNTIAETASRVMNLGKTNFSFEHLLEQFAPQKGDTYSTYADRLQQSSDDMQRRMLEAQYDNSDARGIPVADPDTGTNYGNIDKQAFVDSQMTKYRNIVNGSSQDTSSSSSDDNNTTKDNPFTANYSKNYGLEADAIKKLVGN